MVNYRIIKILFVTVIMVVLCFPLVQMNHPVILLAPLKGIKNIAARPPFTDTGWYSGDFQKDYHRYFEEHVGMRNLLIRLRNQVDYSVFHTTITPGIIIGKNNQLFVEEYLENYFGIFYKGEGPIHAEISQLEIIQHELKKHNVDFLLIFAPGKGTMFHEQVPSFYQNRQKPRSNYQSYIKRIQRSKLNFIDLNGWFYSLKNKTPYPLYPLNGAHWTNYGVGLAADSIVRYIEKMRDIDMPELIRDQVEVSDSMRNSDYDIGELMNLLWPLHNDPMPYPVFRFDTVGKTRPRMISISDSYWWSFTMTPIVVNMFHKDNLWFYFKDIYENQRKRIPVEKIDLRAALFNQDVVIMMVTEATYMLFPYGFIEAFDAKCKDYSTMTNEEKISEWCCKIKSSPGWLNLVRIKAAQNGALIEDQIRADAIFMVNQEKNIPPK